MAQGVKIGSVEQETHVEFGAQGIQPPGDREPATPRRIEVYAGWVVLDDVRDDDGRAETKTLKTFMPVRGATVRAYKDGVQNRDVPVKTDLQVAVSVGLSGSNDRDDEENSTSVEYATVKLEPQKIPGVAGNPLCLVLTIKFYVLNAQVWRACYNVTVSTSALSIVEELDLAKASVPDA